MVLVQPNGRDSPHACPLDRLRNTGDQFRNCSGAGGSRTARISPGERRAAPAKATIPLEQPGRITEQAPPELQIALLPSSSALSPLGKSRRGKTSSPIERHHPVWAAFRHAASCVSSGETPAARAQVRATCSRPGILQPRTSCRFQENLPPHSVPRLPAHTPPARPVLRHTPVSVCSPECRSSTSRPH